jgi:hypothetical protein
MAKVIYQFIGSDKEQIEVGTVLELKNSLEAKNYTVTSQDDEVLGDSYMFQDYDFVVLTANDKSA